MTQPTTEEIIRRQLADNPVIIYMKGSPDAPECGFSAKAVAAIKTTGTDLAFVNVLQAPFIRERLPKISGWPTFPQLFVNGELIGGCDITLDLYQKGELQKMVAAAAAQEQES